MPKRLEAITKRRRRKWAANTTEAWAKRTKRRSGPVTDATAAYAAEHGLDLQADNSQDTTVPATAPHTPG